MVIVNVKPIGINQQYQGRKWLSPVGKKFKESSSLLIKKVNVPEGLLSVKLIFGFSNKAQDIDGAVKSCLDILGKRLNFDDNRVYELHIRKTIVPKGKEFWGWEIEQFKPYTI
jgi:Holliday junction resolvase RusA-like endonuclease